MKTINNYSPLYFLASLGAGGSSVMFFMYLMFMTEHLKTPIPTLNSISSVFFNIDTNIFIKFLIIIAVSGIIFFAYIHIKLLILNIKNFNKFKKTDNYNSLINGNREVQIMAYPLTLAMTVNVMFIIGAVFIPNLWNIIEYLFPIALIAFSIIGIFALKIFTKYLSRIISNKTFDFSDNNNFGQMISIFAFVMIGVGFAASAAMSSVNLTIALGLIGSIFFLMISLIFGTLKFILGFKSIIKYGLNKEMSPTLWIFIPIITLVGITIIRQLHGIENLFNIHINSGVYFILTTILISTQVIFGIIGYNIMKSNKYFEEFINGNRKSAGSYALICPGVALVVFGFFFISLGFVKTGLIDKFSIIYFIMFLPFIYLKIITIRTFFKLNKKMLNL